jgi:Nucleoside-diphosphate-sugar epimerases
MENTRLKILVTGGTGFIGSNLIKDLLIRDYDVYALVRKNSSLGFNRLSHYKNINYIYAEDLFSGINRDLAAESVEGVKAQKNLPTFDICFHLAAYGVDYKQQNLNELIDGNIKYTMNLLEFCRRNKTKKFINTGSCFEYGFNEGKKLSEKDVLNPQTYYSLMKVATEKMANLYSESNYINLITVRPFGVFGENEGFHRLVPQLMKTVIRNEPLDITFGNQIRDYLYIRDLIDAYITLALTDVPFYESYNICSGREVKIKDLALKLSEITGCSMGLFKFGSIPYRKNEIMYFVGDNSKIQKYTGWRPKYTIEDGLKKTYEWYKENLEDML